MTKSGFWLSLFARVCVFATLVLIFVGGLVTTRDAGLAVPDWPLSFGSVNPPGWWETELVRLEHGHRLIGALIGLLTTVLAVWVVCTEKRRWVRWMGVAAFIGVTAQGIMGGLRVTQISTELAVIHGCVAQLFLCLMVVLATVLSPRWSGPVPPARTSAVGRVKFAAAVLVFLVFAQLVVGAIMRHYKAGLAIPDFPLSMGHIVPPYFNFHVAIHFAHRVGAVIVLLWVLHLLATTIKHAWAESRLLAPVVLLAVLVFVQIALGAEIIWRGRATLPTTVHVLNGALILATAVLVVARAQLLGAAGVQVEDEPEEIGGGLPQPAA